jgi:hypothetical protein
VSKIDMRILPDTTEKTNPNLASRIIDYLLARAMLAAFRDQNHKPFITLARVVARISERRAVCR